MNELKIIKATYYDPQIGQERGTDVTVELSAELRNGALFYKGLYNLIFPDHFKRVYKKLRIDMEYKGEVFTRLYNENEKIDLPNDIGTVKKQIMDFKNPWLVTIIGGIVVVVVGLIISAIIFNN